MGDERVLFRFIRGERLGDLLQGKLYVNELKYFARLEAKNNGATTNRD